MTAAAGWLGSYAADGRGARGVHAAEDEASRTSFAGVLDRRRTPRLVASLTRPPASSARFVRPRRPTASSDRVTDHRPGLEREEIAVLSRLITGQNTGSATGAAKAMLVIREKEASSR